MSDIKQDDQDIERLLNAAGQRRNPPPEMRARVYAAARDAWQELPEQQIEAAPLRNWWRGQQALALAATTFVAVAVGMFWMSQGAAPVTTVGDVVFVQGSFRVNNTSTVPTGSAIEPNSRVQTVAQSLVSLRMGSGAMVTMDQHTDVSITAPDVLFLRRGRLYVDAGGAGQDLVVQTPYAKIVDIGTQFEVTVRPDSEELTVAVREGQVDVSGPGHGFSAVAADGSGEVVRMRGTVVQEQFRVATTDERWNWRRAGRKPFALAGSTVYDYLQWMARDSGHELQFARGAVEQMARTGILQGKGSNRSSDDMEIGDALSTTSFVLHNPSPGLWVVDFRN